MRLRKSPPHELPPSLRGLPAETVLDYYRETYETDPGYVGYSERTLKEEIVRAALEVPATRAIDLGCGPNPVVLFDLHDRRPGLSFTGIELSEDFCRHARDNAAKRGVELSIVNASVHDTGLPDASFDLAILAETLEHVPDEIERATLTEARRLLKRGGHLLISVPNRNDLFERYMTWRRGFFEEHPQHLRDYTPESLRPLVEQAGFTIVRALRVPPERSDSRAARLIALLPVPARWSVKAAFLARAD
jgi:SAM-dependent methyltransferase